MWLLDTLPAALFAVSVDMPMSDSLVSGPSRHSPGLSRQLWDSPWLRSVAISEHEAGQVEYPCSSRGSSCCCGFRGRARSASLYRGCQENWPGVSSKSYYVFANCFCSGSCCGAGVLSRFGSRSYGGVRSHFYSASGDGLWSHWVSGGHSCVTLETGSGVVVRSFAYLAGCHSIRSDFCSRRL